MIQPSIRSNRSFDDSLNTVNGYGRRTRSKSPAKKRNSLPPGVFNMHSQTLPHLYDEDLKSLSSGSASSGSPSGSISLGSKSGSNSSRSSISGTSSLSSDKMKQLSKSPLSKKLHITTNNDNGNGQYVIPIPFTLQLPPKLSPKNQKINAKPSSPKSPLRGSKLVFTGCGYEKLDLSDNETEDEFPPTPTKQISPIPPPPLVNDIAPKTTNSASLSPPTTPTKKSRPPLVKSNKKRSAKNKNKNKNKLHAKHLNSDELSMIEEASNSELSSRNSSIRDRLRSAAGERHNPDISAVEEEPSSSAPTIKGSPSGSYKSYGGNDSTFEEECPMSPIAAGLPKSSSEMDLARLQNNGPSNRKDQLLKIHKRSFSDESYVSSISSFSSVGDAFSLNTRKNRELSYSSSTKSPNSNGSKSSSNDSLRTKDSWESLQKSPDISKRNSDSSINTSELTITYEQEPPSNDVDDVAVYQKSGSGHLLPPGSIQEPPDNESSETELADYYMNDDDEYSDQDTLSEHHEENEDSYITINNSDNGENSGVGKKFNFPNNEGNITNSEKLQKRIISTDSYRSGKSRFSYYSTLDGQIEIPDLSEAAYSEAGSIKNSPQSVNGTTFNDLISEDEAETLEPIGIPSKQGKRNATEEFKHLYGEQDSDDETETEAETEAETKSKRTQISLSLNASNSKTSICSPSKTKELPPLPIEKGTSHSTPSSPMPNRRRGHSRHKSLGNINFDADDKQEMNIHVAEPPPKPINYKVDFKEAQKETEVVRSVTSTMNELKRIDTNPSDTTYSSYKTGRSLPMSPSTAFTDNDDNDSVVIDLTDETYDICHVQRNKSKGSYVSITEKHKGEDVEVVLVDDDDSDLASIYSSYGRQWMSRTNSLKSNKSDVSDTSSTASSNFSYDSVASSAKINLGPNNPKKMNAGTIIDQRNKERSGGSISSATSSAYNFKRIQVPQKGKHGDQYVNHKNSPVRQSDNKYLDYKKSSSHYDFDTFMNQKKMVS